MRILVANSYVAAGAGGQERVALDLAIGLQRAGHQVVLFGPYGNSAALRSRIPPEIHFEEAPWACRPPGAQLSAFRFRVETLRLIDQYGIDVVSGHGRMLGVYSACASRSVPLVWTVHGTDMTAVSGGLHLRKQIGRIALKILTGSSWVTFVGVSAFTNECFLRLVGKQNVNRLRKILNGIAAMQPLLSLAPPEFSGPLRIGVVGRLCREKCVQDLPLVVEGLLGRGIAFHLAVFGDGPLERELRQQLAAVALPGYNISFEGFSPDPCYIYSQFDVLLHLSPNDWLPTTLIESLAAGRPVIGYCGGGVPEIVTDGVSGLLGQVGDTSGLVDCLARIDRDRDQSRRFSLQGRQTVAVNFSLERMVQEYCQLFSEILRQRGK